MVFIKMRLWILSASTGGGHDMRAYAMRDWWEKRGGVAEVFHPLEESFPETLCRRPEGSAHRWPHHWEGGKRMRHSIRDFPD